MILNGTVRGYLTGCGLHGDILPPIKLLIFTFLFVLLLFCIIGERNLDGKLHIWPYRPSLVCNSSTIRSFTREYTEDITMDMLDWEMVINDEGNSCRFEDQERNLDTHTICMINGC